MKIEGGPGDYMPFQPLPGGIEQVDAIYADGLTVGAVVLPDGRPGLVFQFVQAPHRFRPFVVGPDSFDHLPRLVADAIEGARQAAERAAEARDDEQEPPPPPEGVRTFELPDWHEAVGRICVCGDPMEAGQMVDVLATGETLHAACPGRVGEPEATDG